MEAWHIYLALPIAEISVADWSIEDLDSNLHFLRGINLNFLYDKGLSRTQHNSSFSPRKRKKKELFSWIIHQINQFDSVISLLRHSPLQVMTFPVVSLSVWTPLTDSPCGFCISLWSLQISKLTETIAYLMGESVPNLQYP